MIGIWNQPAPKFNIFDLLKKPQPVTIWGTTLPSTYTPVSSNLPKTPVFQPSQPITTPSFQQPVQQINNKYLSKQKVKEIIDWRPEGVTPLELFQSLEQKGYVMEGYNEPKQEMSLGQKVWEFATWAFRAGEQIPRVAGNIIWAGLWQFEKRLWTNPLSKLTTQAGEYVKWLWEEITSAWETAWWTQPLTQEQRDLRRMWWVTALTAPIPIKWTNLFTPKTLAGSIGKWAMAGLQWQAVYDIAQEWTTSPQSLALATLVWWVAWPVIEKAIPWLFNKLVETYQKIKTPWKFASQIDDETLKLIRQAVRPSVWWVDTAKKFDIQDSKLLQWVKELVNQWKTPKSWKELMQAIQEIKQNLWNKVSEANKSVLKTTNWEDIALKLRQFIWDPDNKTTFLSRPELKSNLLKYADDLQSSQDFKNITQEQLQEILTDINSRIPASSFLKQLDSNPVETAKNTILAKIYRDIVDDNLEEAVWIAWAEARQAYWAVRQLEKDFSKRYGVYLRQNPKGLSDMFGMEWFADIATGLLTASPWQVLRGTMIQWVKKLIKNANNPDTIIRDIFKLQNKIKW